MHCVQMWLAVACLSPLPLLAHGAAQRRAAPEPVTARRAWDVRGGPGIRRATASIAAVLATVLAALTAIRARLRRRRARSALLTRPPESPVPPDYRAAGVIFYTRDSTGDISHVLLGVEERKVPLRELGQGSGSAKRRVLLFPQGKREPSDRGFIDTARREYVEETDDPARLAWHLEDAISGKTPPLPSTWWADAKMAVVFCEVPESSTVVGGTQPVQEKLPLLPVWVSAADLRRALASTSASSMDVKTKLGWFPLFPVTRRFLQTAGILKWLGMAARRPRNDTGRTRRG